MNLLLVYSFLMKEFVKVTIVVFLPRTIHMACSLESETPKNRSQFLADLKGKPWENS